MTHRLELKYALSNPILAPETCGFDEIKSPGSMSTLRDTPLFFCGSEAIEMTVITAVKPVFRAWLFGALLASGNVLSAETPTSAQTAKSVAAKSGAMQTAVLAGGCFWGVEGVFEHVRGVRDVVSGYAGGDEGDARYKTVGTGRTGHAESVQVTFDPLQITYGEILRIFFSVAHDPTQLNRQGPDTGPQYRSAIFYSTAAQRDLAKTYIGELNESGKFPRAIVTRVDPLKAFYPAESYHQDFMAKNPYLPYVVFNDLPKIRDLKRLYPEYYRDDTRQ